MKILKIILLSVFVLAFAIFGFVFYKWSTNSSPCIPETPKRLGMVPTSAEWIGGCDGGKWFNIIEINSDENRYKIAIYYDYSGELITEKDFYKESNCTKEYLLKKDLLSDILDYDFFEIHMKIKDCHLLPVDNKNE